MMALAWLMLGRFTLAGGDVARRTGPHLLLWMLPLLIANSPMCTARMFTHIYLK